MTRFLDPSFSTYAPGDQSYRDNWDRIFKKKEEPPVLPESKKPEPHPGPEHYTPPFSDDDGHGSSCDYTYTGWGDD